MSAPAAGRRLLVVDDEASLLDFLSLLFRDDGYEVETAGSVEEARRRSPGRASTSCSATS